MKRSTRTLLFAVMALGGGAPLVAQDAWPSRPIRFVSPAAPGSTTDLSVRVIAEHISGPLGQPIIVENRPGAAGQIGMQHVATSKPDGYTFVVVSASTSVVPPAVTRALPYDVLKDFVPVSLIANTRLMMVVAADSPLKSVPDLIKQAKANPGALAYSDGATLYRLSMSLFQQAAGIQLNAVRYSKSSDVHNDLLGGHLAVAPESLGSVSNLLQSGKVRPLAAFSASRIPSLPGVPTMLELGYKDFTFDGWIGLLAPAGTPERVVERIAREISAAMSSEDIRRRYAGWWLDTVSSTPREMAEMMKRDTERFERIARDAGLEKQ